MRIYLSKVDQYIGIFLNLQESIIETTHPVLPAEQVQGFTNNGYYKVNYVKFYLGRYYNTYANEIWRKYLNTNYDIKEMYVTPIGENP